MKQLTSVPHEQQTIAPQRSSWSRFIVFLAVVLLGNLLLLGIVTAAQEQTYKALHDWIEQYRAVSPTWTPGQHLTEADRKALEPFIPQSAWERLTSTCRSRTQPLHIATF